MRKLSNKGVDYSFTSLEKGIFDYYSKLKDFTNQIIDILNVAFIENEKYISNRWNRIYW